MLLFKYKNETTKYSFDIQKKNKKANSKNHDICKKIIIATKVVIIFISVQKHHWNIFILRDNEGEIDMAVKCVSHI